VCAIQHKYATDRRGRAVAGQVICMLQTGDEMADVHRGARDTIFSMPYEEL
jgi:hypothetical protein